MLSHGSRQFPSWLIFDVRLKVSEERVQQLMLRIEEAFRGVPRPRITKSVARGFDDEWSLSEERFKELSALDPEEDWHDIAKQDVDKFDEYFNFSDAEGWRFYLPAYMRHYLSDLGATGNDAVYWACTSKNPKFDLLTPPQLECVREFL